MSSNTPKHLSGLSLDDPWLTTAQVAVYLGYATGTVENWRTDAGRPDGPPYSRIAGSVRYRQSDVFAWVQSRPRVEPAA